MLLDSPSPCHKLSHLGPRASPSCVTYFMDGPLGLALPECSGEFHHVTILATCTAYLKVLMHNGSRTHWNA